MKITAEDISIGITMYRRLDYLEHALRSAVEQTVPVRVILYDDGCQDHERLRAILAKFGDRVDYRRHPKTRGLFGNMNACLEQSPTPWVSVLHDDDALAPDFVERILAIAPAVAGAALFCGSTTFMDGDGKLLSQVRGVSGEEFRVIPLREFALNNQFCFPGQLIHVETALKCEGFPRKSIYSGDWELWFKLALEGGVTQLGANLSFYRAHGGVDRGTNAAGKSGRRFACCVMQVKNNLAKLRARGISGVFDREEWANTNYAGLNLRDFLPLAAAMPTWLLRYNCRLFRFKRSDGMAFKIFTLASRFGGTFGVRCLSRALGLAASCGVKLPQGF